MMDANQAVQYQSPTHIHPQSDVTDLVSDLAAKTDKVPTDLGHAYVSGDISPDATGWYRQNGSYNNSPAFERIGGGWWMRYESAVPWRWRICEGSDVNTAVSRWSAPSSYVFPVVAPDTGSYSPLAGATGTATVALGTMARDYLASYDTDGNLVRGVPKSDVAIKTDGMYYLSGKVQEGTGTTTGDVAHAEGASTVAAGANTHAEGANSVAGGNYAHAEGSASVASGQYCHAEGGATAAAGNYSHAEGCSSQCGYASDYCTISGTTVTISGDVRSHFSNGDSILFWSLSGATGSKASQARSVSSVPTYASSNTTFSINSALTPAHTSGRVASQNKGRYAHTEGCANVALSDSAHVEGSNNSVPASSTSAHVEGDHNTASANYTHAEGYYTSASAQGAHASGYYSSTNKQYQRALASGRFAAAGDSQYTEIVLRRATADATPAELTIDGAAPSGTTENTSNRFICATGKTYACLVMIAARQSDGTSAFLLRQVVIKNVGGTISLEGSVQTVGVDINPSGWTVPAITADNTNKSLAITVTGVAATNIRWSATIQSQEILY
jgi:hypothetical protein